MIPDQYLIFYRRAFGSVTRNVGWAFGRGQRRDHGRPSRPNFLFFSLFLFFSAPIFQGRVLSRSLTPFRFLLGNWRKENGIPSCYGLVIIFLLKRISYSRKRLQKRDIIYAWVKSGREWVEERARREIWCILLNSRTWSRRPWAKILDFPPLKFTELKIRKLKIVPLGSEFFRWFGADLYG